MAAKSDKDKDATNVRVTEIFKKLDRDKDGRISVKELSAALKGYMPDSELRARELIGKSDGNQDAEMSFEEFLEYVTNQETQLKLAFAQLDRNKDQTIDAEEIQAAMADLGVKIGLAEAEKLLRKMDRDGSLTIDFQEWRDFLLFAGTADIKKIFQYWHKSSAIDIGENMCVPDDFTEEERQSGVAMKILASGGVAGAISRTSTAPLDRLKVMWQAHGSKDTGGIGAAFRTMLKEGGFASLWRGNGVNCLKIAPESGIKFVAYERYKLLLTGGEKRDVLLIEKFVAGALAGATAQTIIYPMEVLKTRMCLRKTGQYSSIFDCARKVYAEGGVGLFYRGYLPNILGILPYAGIDLALFETFKNKYSKWKGDTDAPPPIYVSLTAGASASVCGQVCTYPLALVRTKLQSGKVDTPSQSLKGIFSHILRTEGIPGIYRGIFPNMLKVIPAVSISYAVFDQMKESLGIR